MEKVEFLREKEKLHFIIENMSQINWLKEVRLWGERVKSGDSCLKGAHAFIIESLRLRTDMEGLVSAVTRTAIPPCPSFGVMTNNKRMCSDNYVEYHAKKSRIP